MGAAGVLEFIVAILAQRESLLPPTANFVSARPGCDLDYVPNEARPAQIRSFLSNSAAFGGINVSLVGGSPAAARPAQPRERDELWLTGVGVVSPVGCGREEFRRGLIEKRSGIKRVEQFDVTGLPSRHAAILGEFQARKLAPTIDVRRTDPLNRYAMVAAALALKDSRLEVRAANSERVGMVMCLNYGSLAVQERFRDSLAKDGLEKMSAKHFPSMVVSTVGGTVSQAFNLRGVNSTIVDGITGGLQGFIHAAEVMQGNPDLDAMVVVAADEISPLLFRVFNQRGWLAATNDDEHPFLNAYRTGNQGWLLGEGGAALILERASTAKARGAKPLAILGGYGLSADAVLAPEVEPTGQWYRQAIDAALHDAAIQSANVDLVYGHGRGETQHDARELRVFEQLFANRNIPIGNVMENVGVCAASSGLLSLIAGGLSLQNGEAYPVVGSLPVSNSPVSNSAVRFIDTCAQLAIANVLVAGSTENGNNAAVVLKSVEATV